MPVFRTATWTSLSLHPSVRRFIFELPWITGSKERSSSESRPQDERANVEEPLVTVDHNLVLQPVRLYVTLLCEDKLPWSWSRRRVFLPRLWFRRIFLPRLWSRVYLSLPFNSPFGKWLSCADYLPLLSSIQLASYLVPGGGGGGGHLNVTWREVPIFQESPQPFRKKNCISIPCFGTIRLQKIPKTIGKQ